MNHCRKDVAQSKDAQKMHIAPRRKDSDCLNAVFTPQSSKIRLGHIHQSFSHDRRLIRNREHCGTRFVLAARTLSGQMEPPPAPA
jgi:hypothetical protein